MNYPLYIPFYLIDKSSISCIIKINICIEDDFMRYRFLCFPEFKHKAVTLSYDYDVRDNLLFAEKIEKYGFKCTFSFNSGLMGTIDGEGGLTYNETKTHLLSKVHEVAVHGDMHCASGLCSSVKVTREVLDCRIKLENELGIIIRGMAYQSLIFSADETLLLDF